MLGSEKCFNRDEIKLLAVLAMVLNHISTIFLAPGHFLSEAMLDVGYLTAPVMCYFLVEGYAYTHSKRSYGLRLAVFAAVSEIPYCLAFTEEGFLEFAGMNMIFTLFLCFLQLCARERITDPFLRIGAIVLLTVASAVSDWGVLAPVMTLLFARAREYDAGGGAVTCRSAANCSGAAACSAVVNCGRVITCSGAKKHMDGTKQFAVIPENAGRGAVRKTAAKAFAYAAVLFGMSELGGIDRLSARALLGSLGGVMGVVLAAFLILFCYNGKRAEKGRRLLGWFFYVFYPGHLLVLGILRILWLS